MMREFEILFVDDDEAILEMVDRYLTGEGYKVITVDSGLEALEILKSKDIEIVFTDFKMPELSGIELLAAIKESRPETEVIIVTGHGTMESVIQAMKIGSYDYLQKPFKLSILKMIIDRIIDEKKLKNENVFLKTRLKERHNYQELIGINLKMREIFTVIDRISGSSPNVLIHGESGVGKELTAGVIHRNSNRKDKPLININCRSLLKNESESNPFDKFLDSFKTAKDGAIFLDGIADLTLPIQKKFLDILKNDNEAVSGKKEIYNIRFIGATDKALEELIKQGEINKEFVSLLNEVDIRVPPLRDRKEDIALLIHHFLFMFNNRNRKKILNVSPTAMDLLLTYHWPGNVIQLENVIERAFALGVEWVIDVEDLPEEIITFGKISGIS